MISIQFLTYVLCLRVILFCLFFEPGMFRYPEAVYMGEKAS